jgi:hypothetical protein
MPIDVTRIPALEEELEQAKRVKGGGQEPRPDRIAAIEEQLELHRAELARNGAPAAAEPENASDVSTDYESHDSDAAEKKASRKKGSKSVKDPEPEVEEAVAEPAEEVTFATEEPLETADATDDLEVR